MKRVLNRLRAVLILFILLLPLWCSVMFFLIARQPGDLRQATAPGMPYCFEEEREYPAELTDVRASGDYVYLLYGPIFLVEVYTSDGAYLRTLVMPKEASGAPQIAVEGSTLYFRHNADLYRFEDAVFADHESLADDKDLLSAVRSQAFQSVTDGSGNRYSIRRASVWRTTPEGKSAVFVARSPWLLLCSYPFWWCVLALWFIVFIGLQVWARRGSRPKEACVPKSPPAP